MAEYLTRQQVKDFLQRALVARQSLDQLEGLDNIIMIGITGSGKSTAASVQLGCVFEYDKDLQQYVATHIPVKAPRTNGCTVDSYTTHARRFVNPDLSKDGFVDMAGQMDTRPGFDVFVRTAASAVFSITATVRAIICIPKHSLDFSRENSTTSNLAKQITGLFPGFGRAEFLQTIAPSFVFVIKQSYDGHRGQANTPDNIRKPLERQLAALETKISSMRPPSEQAPSSEMDEQQARAGSLREQISFAEALLAAIDDDRVYFSDPDGMHACTAQRLAVAKMLTRATRLSGEVLDEVGRRRRGHEETFEYVNTVLPRLCRDLTTDVDEAVDVLTKLIRLLADHGAVLQRIRAGDWQAVKKEQLAILVEDAAALTDQLERTIAEIARMQQDTRPSTLADYPVSMARWSSFWSVLADIFAGSWATTTVSYNGGPDKPFTDYDVLQKANREVQVLQNDPQGGKLRLRVSSSRGHDLRHRLVVTAPTNTLPATRDAVAELQRTEAGLRTRQAALLDKIARLASANGGDELKLVLLHGLTELETRRMAVETKLSQPYPELARAPKNSLSREHRQQGVSEELTPLHVLHGTVSMADLFLRAGLLPVPTAEGAGLPAPAEDTPAREVAERLCRQWRLYQRLRQNADLVAHSTNHLADISPVSVPEDEFVAPNV